MKTVLAISVAAFAICAGGAASAETASISFDGFCDGIDIIVHKADRTALETGNGCDEGAHFGAGTIGKIKGRGNAITFGIDLTPKGGGAYQYIFVVSYPLVTGATWSEFYTTDGKTIQGRYTGTYTVTGAGARLKRGVKSAIDAPTQQQAGAQTVR